jgi:hypothetical protein
MGVALVSGTENVDLQVQKAVEMAKKIKVN